MRTKNIINLSFLILQKCGGGKKKNKMVGKWRVPFPQCNRSLAFAGRVDWIQTSCGSIHPPRCDGI